MKYTHFEVLAFVLGSAAVVTSIFLAPTEFPQAAEVTAQLLLIAVLAGALHWGRNGGFLSALVAIAVYVAMRVPLLHSEGLSRELLTLLGTRALTYALVGVVGGELAARIKYLFARIENDSLVDPFSGVYSARYAADSILSGVGQWDRYQTEYSVVTVTLSDEMFASYKSRRIRHMVRQVANYVRNDIRMVDDLATGGVGTFYILLPRTDAGGAAVVAARLSAGVRDSLGVTEDAVHATVLSAAQDAPTLKSLAAELSPVARVSAPQPVSDDRRASATPQEPLA
ncbi:MAG: hypothetical protein EG823_05165 [Actinobacteria bacterium]|nr:hypothetical protein [Actinomycetota bacterium]